MKKVIKANRPQSGGRKPKAAKNTTNFQKMVLSSAMLAKSKQSNP